MNNKIFYLLKNSSFNQKKNSFAQFSSKESFFLKLMQWEILEQQNHYLEQRYL